MSGQAIRAAVLPMTSIFVLHIDDMFAGLVTPVDQDNTLIAAMPDPRHCWDENKLLITSRLP